MNQICIFFKIQSLTVRLKITLVHQIMQIKIMRNLIPISTFLQNVLVSRKSNFIRQVALEYDKPVTRLMTTFQNNVNDPSLTRYRYSTSIHNNYVQQSFCTIILPLTKLLLKLLHCSNCL